MSASGLPSAPPPPAPPLAPAACPKHRQVQAFSLPPKGHLFRTRRLHISRWPFSASLPPFSTQHHNALHTISGGQTLQLVRALARGSSCAPSLLPLEDPWKRWRTLGSAGGPLEALEDPWKRWRALGSAGGPLEAHKRPHKSTRALHKPAPCSLQHRQVRALGLPPLLRP